MRGIALAVIVVGILLGTSTTATSSLARKPALRVVPASSLVIRGSGFKSAERVRLSAQTRDGVLRKTIKASATGTFVSRWALAADYCTGISAVRATDSAGRTVSIRVASVMQDCMPVAP